MNCLLCQCSVFKFICDSESNIANRQTDTKKLISLAEVINNKASETKND